VFSHRWWTVDDGNWFSWMKQDQKHHKRLNNWGLWLNWKDKCVKWVWNWDRLMVCLRSIWTHRNIPLPPDHYPLIQQERGNKFSTENEPELCETWDTRHSRGGPIIMVRWLVRSNIKSPECWWCSLRWFCYQKLCSGKFLVVENGNEAGSAFCICIDNYRV